jgi:hypothetical protein
MCTIKKRKKGLKHADLLYSLLKKSRIHCNVVHSPQSSINSIGPMIALKFQLAACASYILA